MKRHAVIVGLFLLVALLVYGLTITYGFVAFDDSILVYDNIAVIRPLRWESIVWAITHYDPELYIPVTVLMFQIESALGGLQPWIFHSDNILLHTANALLVTLFLTLLLYAKNRSAPAGICSPLPLPPILCGLLFLVHPLNVEAVAWVSGRKDLLSGFFFLASVCSYLVYRNGNRRLYAASVAAFVLALGANVRVAPLPFVLLLIDWYLDGHVAWRNVWEKKAYVIAAVLFGLIALLGKDQVLGRTDVFAALLLVGRSSAFYIEKFFIPLNLSILYPYDPENIRITTPGIALSWAAVAAAAVALAAYRKRFRAWIFGSVFFMIMLLPSFFQYYRGNELYFATDRYAYISMIGLLFIICTLFGRLRPERERVAASVAAVILIVFGGLALYRSRVWQDTLTLFSDALAQHESALAHEKVGTELFIRKQHKEAVEHFVTALQIDPKNAASYYSMGLMSLELGETADARKFTEQSLSLNPNHPYAHLNMSKILWDEGRRNEALEHAERAVELHGWEMMGLGNLATMYTLMGREEEARAVIAWMLELEPGNERVKPLLEMMGQRVR